jgi:hypothetical protein
MPAFEPVAEPGAVPLPRTKRTLLPAVRPFSALTASVVLAVLIQAYAGTTLRGVYADGAYFVTQLAARRAIFDASPARMMSYLITQLPVVAAMHLGVQTPHGVALVFSLVTNILPGLFILLCLPALPAGDRQLFIIPAFVYFAGILGSQFASVIEGLVATSYFWLLLCLITFSRLTILRSAAITLLSAGSLWLYEDTLYLAPILAASCAMRWQNARGRLPHIVLSIAALCAVASTVIGGYYMFYPTNAPEKASFIFQFLHLWWIHVPGKRFNIPCVLAILAGLCIFVTMLRPAWGAAVMWMFAAFSISLALVSFQFDRLIDPFMQFTARHNAALMSLPLGILFLFARVHGPFARAITRRPARGIVAFLGVTVSLWHVGATEQWSAFLARFSSALQARNGIIAWDIVAAPPGSRDRQIAANMLWAWTNPDLSLIALPRSCVNSVIANPTWYRGWQPYSLSDLSTMPAIPGVTYTYLLPPDQQHAACPAAP